MRVARRVRGAPEAHASEAGLTWLRLETDRTLVEARALYGCEGDREAAPFKAEPYADHWFERTIHDGQRQDRADQGATNVA